MYGIFELTLRNGDVYKARATTLMGAIRWANATLKLDIKLVDIKQSRFEPIELPKLKPDEKITPEWIGLAEKIAKQKVEAEEVAKQKVEDEDKKFWKRVHLFSNMTTISIVLFFIFNFVGIM